MKWCWWVMMGLMLATPVQARKKAPPADMLLTEHAQYLPFMQSLAENLQRDKAELETIFQDVRLKSSIIRAMSRPAEAKPWDQYRPIFVNEQRILGGLDFWDQHAAALVRARERFQVPESMIVAIIGVETMYGRNTGSFRVLDALTTLAVDYPPRSDYFQRELEQYLTLVQEHNIDPLSIKGSYAGAMGIGQFMPSSYRKYGIDFDNDQHPDLWSNYTDAIGSVANYFKSFGWKPGEPVVLPVEVRGEETREFANTGWSARKTVEEWQQQGVVVKEPLWPQIEAMLIRTDTANGPEFWLGFNNYYVITRYNRSLLYALAVYQLSQEIEAARRPAYPDNNAGK